MKLFEITIKPDRVTIRQESEEQLTREQKCAVILTVIICATVLGFIALMTGTFR